MLEKHHYTAPLPPEAQQAEARRGLFSAMAAFLLWGCLPLYWKLLQAVPAFEILCHRIIWSFFGIVLVLLFRSELGRALTSLKDKKILLTLVASGLLLTSNWFLFIYAITSDRVIETSLGYYTTPILNMCMGVFFLKERTNLAVWASLGFATFGILFQLFALGHLPWLALGLAVTFAVYGFLRKIVVVDALTGLMVETAIVFLPCLAYVIFLDTNGSGAFHFGTGNADQMTINALLIVAGFVTTLPLFFFTYAARRISLTALGLMQYISPTITFLIGLFVFKEDFTLARLVTFACVWTAIAIYTADSLRHHHARTHPKPGK